MDAKYEALLDDEVKAYLARYDALYPADAVDLDIAGQRRVYDAVCAEFDTGHPTGVTAHDESYGDVPCRHYETTGAGGAATIVYYHGGGFVVGGLDSHDSICADICAETGLRVIAVDYPLAPEFGYPHDFNAALAAYNAVAAQFCGTCLVCGDSAGANLAAAVSHKMRGSEIAPRGQVLIYGAFGGGPDLPSYTEHANAPHLTAQDIAFYAHVRPGGAPPTNDPCYAPLQDTGFSNLPATLCIAAECDPIASDSIAYAKAIMDAGGQARAVVEPGLVHGYLRARSMSSKAAASFARICAGLKNFAA